MKAQGTTVDTEEPWILNGQLRLLGEEGRGHRENATWGQRQALAKEGRGVPAIGRTKKNRSQPFLAG